MNRWTENSWEFEETLSFAMKMKMKNICNDGFNEAQRENKELFQGFYTFLVSVLKSVNITFLHLAVNLLLKF